MPVMPDFWKSTEYSGLWPLNVAAVTVTPHLNGTWKFGAAEAVAAPAGGGARAGRGGGGGAGGGRGPGGGGPGGGRPGGGGKHGEPSQPGHGETSCSNGTS